MFRSEFEVSGVSKRFGPILALEDVSLVARAGEVHAVIGENGAGKSTLMNIISGNLKVSSGEIRIDGRPVHFASPIDAQAQGVAIAPQEILLVPDLTIMENVLLGRQVARGGVVDWRATRAEARRHLDALDPAIDPDMKAGAASTAQQQLVQIARATSTGARVLIFDEPTAALTSKEAARLFDFIRRFREGGGAVFYISHRLDEILALADRITVLRDGRHVATLDPRATTKDEMIRAMAGRAVAELDLRRAIPAAVGDEVVLKVDGLTRPGEFEDVSFELKRGEILAIGGLIGAGRTEVARCIFGLARPQAGRVEIFGDARPVRDPADAIARSLVYLPEERKQDGIFPLLSIAENLTMATLDRYRRPAWMDFRAMAQTVEDYIGKLRIRIGSPRDPITSLSGGNQQKVILARWLAKNSRILILDEPTRGIDVAAKSEIQGLLDTLTEEGLSIVYISSELDEVLAVSDRILVMHEGEVKGTVHRRDATPESLLSLAMS